MFGSPGVTTMSEPTLETRGIFAHFAGLTLIVALFRVVQHFLLRGEAIQSGYQPTSAPVNPAPPQGGSGVVLIPAGAGCSAPTAGDSSWLHPRGPGLPSEPERPIGSA